MRRRKKKVSKEESGQGKESSVRTLNSFNDPEPSTSNTSNFPTADIANEPERKIEELNSSADSFIFNKEEIILKVNTFFMEDLRCPRLTPFGVINFSCSSVTSCTTQNHKESAELLSTDDEQVLMSLVTEKCWNLLLAPLNCHLSGKIYFSPLMLRSIFYGISVESDDNICLGLLNILKAHLKFHPPCRKDMRKLYHQVLLGNIKIGELTNPDLVKYNFNSIIEAIEQACETSVAGKIENHVEEECGANTNDNTATPSTIKDLFLYISAKYINNTDMLALPEFNYHKSQLNEDINQIDSAGQMKRLMLIFGIVLDILEENFRMWWMKSRYKLKEKLNSSATSPLVADVAWKKSELKGSINEHCIRMFILYKNCPRIYRHNISRYLALLFEVARANEENKEKMFPYFSILCRNFAVELSFHIKGKDKVNEETVELVEFIYPCWLRFKITAILLKSDLTSGGVDDLRSIYRIILRNLSKKEHVRKQTQGRILRRNLKLTSVKSNVKNSEGETIIHKFCRTNKFKSLELYLQYPETDVNIADNVGWTPLHNAATYNSVECLNSLLKYRFPPKGGAKKLNLSCLNEENESPLMCAVKSGNAEIVNILLKNGAGPTVWNINRKGASAMDLAQDAKIKDILLKSWEESISTYDQLVITSVEIDLLTIMLTSYYSVYHTVQVLKTECMASTHDAVYKFNYCQFAKDLKNQERLCFIVNKLCKDPSNPKELENILFCIKPF